MSIALRLILVFLFIGLIDLYAFQAIKTVFKSMPWARYAYWAISAGVYLYLIMVLLKFDRDAGPQNTFFKYFMGVFILYLVPKLILILIMFGEDLIRVVVGAVQKVSGQGGDFLPDRRKFVSQVALGLAAIPFLGILHGIVRGRYNYQVLKKTIEFDDLPEAFDGLQITHISDIHSGSFDNPEKVRYGIDLINQQGSDMILFTGDMVNNRADEMLPWIKDFSRLRAPMGKFSILGNHDYGDYVNWPSAEAKKQNMAKLFDVHKELGFKLLRNERATVERGNQKINLIGVENWGSGGFAKHGDLNKAAADVDEQDFNVLLSHDPSHFEEVVKKFNKKMQLTLSGHTHGMQFGIEIPGIVRWSPAQYRYPKWAGLYEEMDRKLYVNRGFGYLAFPGRVGIWPEITVLTLKRKTA